MLLYKDLNTNALIIPLKILSRHVYSYQYNTAPLFKLSLIVIINITTNYIAITLTYKLLNDHITITSHALHNSKTCIWF